VTNYELRSRRAGSLDGTLPVEAAGGAFVRAIPIVVVVLTAVAGLAWHENGSPFPRSWLPYAFLVALVLGVLVCTGGIAVPTPPAVAALAGLLALTVFETITIAWSAVPSQARDEALLTLLYAGSFAIAAFALRTRRDRVIALAAIATGACGLAVVTAFALVTRTDVELLFHGGRLNFPVSYVNAQAALMLLGFWPALATAARRTLPVAVRGAAVAGASATLCGWLLTQSKGAGIGLIASSIAVFALSQRRLRLFVPFALAIAVAAVGAVPLTDPIRSLQSVESLRASVHHAGSVMLLLTALAAGVGVVYALLDRRLEIPSSGRRLLGRLALVTTVVVVLGGSMIFFTTVEGPGTFVTRQWQAFKTPPKQEGSTHLLTLGSNRYDVWRVGLAEFAKQPLVGIGARGFGPAYLEHRRSNEQPARAHSLQVDVLSETGLIGFGLLVIALGPPLIVAGRRAKGELAGVAAFGTGIGWLAHASVDWIWTIPAVGVLVFLVLATATVDLPREPRSRTLGRRRAILTGVAIIVLGLIAFVPPWLAARYNERAARGGAGTQNDIAWAKRLDPLALEPYLTQAVWSPNLTAAIQELRKAVRHQPRSWAAHYLLGINLLKTGQFRDAHEELFRAHKLNPNDRLVNDALKLAPYSRPPR
jgi:xanthosine utilization system XapX-like protein